MTITVFESFEGTPLTGDQTWTKTIPLIGGPQAVTVVSSTLHATEGTHSWKLTGSLLANNFPGIQTGPFDLSAYASVSIDTYSVTMPANGALLFILYSSSSGPEYDTIGGDGVTGAQTLTASIADALAAGIDVTSCYIFISAFDDLGLGTGSVEYHIDNLRLDDGTSTTINVDKWVPRLVDKVNPIKRAVNASYTEAFVVDLPNQLINKGEWRPRFIDQIPSLGPNTRYQWLHSADFVVDLPNQQVIKAEWRPEYDDQVPRAGPNVRFEWEHVEPFTVDLPNQLLAFKMAYPELVDLVPVRKPQLQFQMQHAEGFTVDLPDQIINRHQWGSVFPDKVPGAKVSFYKTDGMFRENQTVVVPVLLNWEAAFPDKIILDRKVPSQSQEFYTVDEAGRSAKYNWTPELVDWLPPKKVYNTFLFYTPDEALRSAKYFWRPQFPEIVRAARKTFYDTQQQWSPDEKIRAVLYEWRSEHPDTVPGARRGALHSTQEYQTFAENVYLILDEWRASYPDFARAAKRTFYETEQQYVEDEAVRITKYEWRPEFADRAPGALRAYYDSETFFQAPPEDQLVLTDEWRASFPDFARSAKRTFYETEQQYVDDESVRLVRYEWRPEFVDQVPKNKEHLDRRFITIGWAEAQGPCVYIDENFYQNADPVSGEVFTDIVGATESYSDSTPVVMTTFSTNDPVVSNIFSNASPTEGDIFTDLDPRVPTDC